MISWEFMRRSINSKRILELNKSNRRVTVSFNTSLHHVLQIYTQTLNANASACTWQGIYVLIWQIWIPHDLTKSDIVRRQICFFKGTLDYRKEVCLRPGTISLEGEMGSSSCMCGQTQPHSNWLWNRASQDKGKISSSQLLPGVPTEW